RVVGGGAAVGVEAEQAVEEEVLLGGAHVLLERAARLGADDRPVALLRGAIRLGCADRLHARVELAVLQADRDHRSGSRGVLVRLDPEREVFDVAGDQAHAGASVISWKSGRAASLSASLGSLVSNFSPAAIESLGLWPRQTRSSGSPAGTLSARVKRRTAGWAVTREVFASRADICARLSARPYRRSSSATSRRRPAERPFWKNRSGVIPRVVPSFWNRAYQAALRNPEENPSMSPAAGDTSILSIAPVLCRCAAISEAARAPSSAAASRARMQAASISLSSSSKRSNPLTVARSIRPRSWLGCASSR